MNETPIQNWKTINRAFPKWDTLLIGNGASIALSEKFSYRSLFDYAKDHDLLQKSLPLFSRFKSNNFEEILLACWYANMVNSALENPSHQITELHNEIRDALIRTINEIHPEYSNIEQTLPYIASFASKFRTIFSLNYDITFYWSILQFNSTHRYHFKDLFINGTFDPDTKKYRNNFNNNRESTLVFYPHGNLFIKRNNKDFIESKIQNNNCTNQNLLENIIENWNSESCTPVFISEGTSENKVSSIMKSQYLSKVYENILKKEIKRSLVIYGFSFSDNDDHILKAIAKNKIKRVAVSVYSSQEESEKNNFLSWAEYKLKRFLGKDIKIIFFESNSPGCWNNK